LRLQWREHRLIASEVAQVATECGKDAGPVDVVDRAHSIKTNIADSLNVVVHIERRPGQRFISEVLEINSYDPDSDLFDFRSIYVGSKDHA
jgi:hypothetical protein